MAVVAVIEVEQEVEAGVVTGIAVEVVTQANAVIQANAVVPAVPAVPAVPVAEVEVIVAELSE